MSRTPIDQLIPRADKHIVRAFPRVAQRLENSVDEMDRAQMDTFLKILPGAIERFTAVVTPTNNLHESVETAIIQLVASFPKKSFESQPASSDDPAPDVDTSNMSAQTGESVDGDSDSELPNGSDTDQSVAPISLSRNELPAPAGNGGEPDSPQESPRNSRVRTRSKLSGRAIAKRRVWATGESADDQGRLSESEGGSQAYVDARRQAESRPSNVPRNAKG